MDTRSKIVAADDLCCSGKRLKLIIGYFDPLLADHARALRTLSRLDECVVVAVDDPPNPFLNRRARQELVAALDCVNYVIDFNGALNADEVIDLRDEDLTFRSLLVDRVVGHQIQR